MITLERTTASKQFSDAELKAVLELLKREFSSDFVLAFVAMFWEQQERIAQLESRLAALEAKRK